MPVDHRGASLAEDCPEGLEGSGSARVLVHATSSGKICRVSGVARDCVYGLMSHSRYMNHVEPVT